LLLTEKTVWFCRFDLLFQVIDLVSVRKRAKMHGLLAAFPYVGVYYAVKANPDTTNLNY